MSRILASSCAILRQSSSAASTSAHLASLRDPVLRARCIARCISRSTLLSRATSAVDDRCWMHARVNAPPFGRSLTGKQAPSEIPSFMSPIAGGNLWGQNVTNHKPSKMFLTVAMNSPGWGCASPEDERACSYGLLLFLGVPWGGGLTSWTVAWWLQSAAGWHDGTLTATFPGTIQWGFYHHEAALESRSGKIATYSSCWG